MREEVTAWQRREYQHPFPYSCSVLFCLITCLKPLVIAPGFLSHVNETENNLDLYFIEASCKLKPGSQCLEGLKISGCRIKTEKELLCSFSNVVFFNSLFAF